VTHCSETSIITRRYITEDSSHHLELVCNSRVAFLKSFSNYRPKTKLCLRFSSHIFPSCLAYVLSEHPDGLQFSSLYGEMEESNTSMPGHWPLGLRHELSSPARTLRSWVRIPLEA
jgi:hypothetical protein